MVRTLKIKPLLYSNGRVRTAYLFFTPPLTRLLYLIIAETTLKMERISLP